MDLIAKLQQLYEDYIAEADKVKKNASWFDGMFGMGNDPRKHACHDAFYHAAQAWTADFAAAAPGPEDALAAAGYILEAPHLNRQSESYMFLFVALGNIETLIPFLRAEDCRTLAERLNALYPRRDRLPLQQQVFKKLQKAGK